MPDARAALGVVTTGVIGGALLGAAGSVPTIVPVVMSVMLLAVGCWGFRGALWSALAVGAVALGLWRAMHVLHPGWPPDHVTWRALPARGELIARVLEVPRTRGERTTMAVAAEAFDGHAAVGRIRLAMRGVPPALVSGDRVRVWTTLRRPRRFATPGAFDAEAHLARQGIVVSAFVWNPGTIERLPGASPGIRARIERWRARVTSAIAEAVDPPARGVVQALVVGEEREVAPALRDAFTRAGVVHVLSISGLHVGMVAAVVALLGRWLLGRSEVVLLATDVRLLAALCTVPPVLLYAGLAGMGVATARAAIMVVAGVVAALLGRRVDVLRTLVLAALVLTLVSPTAPLDVSFQLSFLSVLGIVVGVRAVVRGTDRRARVTAALVASPMAILATAPLTAFHFHQVSVAGLVANPVVIPLFGSVVVGLGLVGALAEPVSPLVATACFRLAGLAVRPGIRFVTAVARQPWAAMDVPIPNVGEIVLLYAAIGALPWLGRRAGRIVVVLALVGLLVDAAWWVRIRWFDPRTRVSFLDVGQGDATVIELPGGRVWVVDAGGMPGTDFDTGAAIVGPFLWTRKIRRLDALIMTHAHPDHSGGLAYLVIHHRPREFWWTGVPGHGRDWDRLTEALAATGTPMRVLHAGDVVPPATVLHPPLGWPGTDLNESSLTLRLATGGSHVLLTGDVERDAEDAILARPGLLRATVVKVAHHGSATSSTPPFVAATRPAIAVISVGSDNRYGLPAPEVEARWRSVATCVLRTDVCGTVTVEMDDRPHVTSARPGCECPG